MGHKAQGAFTLHFIMYPIPFSTAPSSSYGTDLGRGCQVRLVRPLACLGYCGQR
jgi:hypothetical protein